MITNRNLRQALNSSNAVSESAGDDQPIGLAPRLRANLHKRLPTPRLSKCSGFEIRYTFSASPAADFKSNGHTMSLIMLVSLSNPKFDPYARLLVRTSGSGHY
jgi:hypothetical protein